MRISLLNIWIKILYGMQMNLILAGVCATAAGHAGTIQVFWPRMTAKQQKLQAMGILILLRKEKQFLRISVCLISVISDWLL